MRRREAAAFADQSRARSRAEFSMRLVFTLLLALLAAPAQAGSADKLIERWYDALQRVDRAELAALLSDNAVIRLNDLKIEQTKAEFIASMDEWEAAVVGTTLRFRIEGEAAGVTTVTVCYDFPDNDILMREAFITAGDVIVSSTQTTIADDCAAY
jgi:hypothetical protein